MSCFGCHLFYSILYLASTNNFFFFLGAIFYHFCSKVEIWTLKESYVKTVGTGLNLDLRTLNFSVEEPLTCDRIITSTKLEVEKVKTSWIFEESYLDKEHVVSVAKDGFSENIEEDVETKFEVLTIQQIFGLISVNQAEAELRIVDPSDFSTFCSKDHPKPF